MVPDDGQQPAPWEIQSLSGRRQERPSEEEVTARRAAYPTVCPPAAELRSTSSSALPLSLTPTWHVENSPKGVDTLLGENKLSDPPGACTEANQNHTYSEPSISRGTACKTTSGPMLATAAPTALSRAAVWGK